MPFGNTIGNTICIDLVSAARYHIGVVDGKMRGNQMRNFKNDLVVEFIILMCLLFLSACGRENESAIEPAPRETVTFSVSLCDCLAAQMVPAAFKSEALVKECEEAARFCLNPDVEGCAPYFECAGPEQD